MASRSHRWPGGNHPLTAFHGGTAKAAIAVIKERRAQSDQPRVPRARLEERERAVEVARANLNQLLSKLPPVPEVRKDRVRPSSARAPRRALDIQAERKVWLGIHMARQNDRCAYCFCRMRTARHKTQAAMRATVDHIIPMSKGGDDSIENTCAACFACNNEKSDMMPDEFRALLATRGALPTLSPLTRLSEGGEI